MNTPVLNTYLNAAYKDGGRGNGEYDCWGLVREVRHSIIGKPLLPSYGDISANDKKGLTTAAICERKALSAVNPRHGAIATCWRGRLCLHVGIVINAGRLMVMDIGKTKGCRIMPIADFEKQFLQVKYYD